MKSLFDNATMGKLSLKNRFVRSATYERRAKDDGHLNDEIYNIYESLAKGGVGLIIGSYAYVTKDEQPSPKMLGIYDDSFIEDYKILGKIVHKYDCKYIQQIVYGGSLSSFEVGNREILGPSAVENKITKVTPKEMTIEDIELLKKAFSEAALRVKKSGLDGVQIHGAHGYLLSQFLSPYYNRRTDEYGGNVENRGRIILEVYDEIRRVVGSEFTVTIKINCSDFDDEGATFEECKYVCYELDKRGIDGIEISGSGNYSSDEISYRDSVFRDYGEIIADNVNCKVMIVCKNNNLNTMEEILNNSKIECFSMSRPLICEPDLINRWESGDRTKPKCLYCGNCMSVGKTCILHK